MEDSVADGGILRGRYRLVTRIGEGAHGRTYFAEHEFLNHPCVVKILAQRVADPSAPEAERLRNEARAGFRVDDPAVVRVLDCDTIQGYWFFVMEYIDGQDLAAVLDTGARLSWRQALGVAGEAASGLAAIHNAGLVHRDIKPANLLLDVEGRIHIADLGVAGLAEAEPGANPTAVGTLRYAPPEVFEPQVPYDRRGDLYSLGAVLFHLLTGKPPHASGRTLQDLIDAQSRAVRWSEEDCGDIPEWLVGAILKLLATDPADRFHSAQEFLAHLTQPDPDRTVQRRVARTDAAGLEPTGVAVLAFRNEADSADDWLGYALAAHVSRALARLGDLFVVPQERLTQVLRQRHSAADRTDATVLLEAGRLVGANTLIHGGFRRVGDDVQVRAVAHCSGRSEPVPVASITRPLSDLLGLQSELAASVMRTLEVEPAAGEQAEPVFASAVLETQEQLTLGKQAYERGDYNAAMEFARRALDLDPECVEPLQYIGACHARLGNYEAAEEHHRRQLDIAERRGDRRLVVEAQTNLGVMHYFRGQYEQAHEYYAQAAAAAESLRFKPELAEIRNNLGFVLSELGRVPEAREAFAKSIEIHKGYGALASLVGPYNGMGNVLLKEKRYEQAADYYARALILAREIGDPIRVGVSHMNLGHCASLCGRFGQAKNEFALAMNSLTETSFLNGLARLYAYMAEMNLRLNDFDEAVRCAEKRIELARRHENRSMEFSAWQQKADALRRAGREEEARACMEQAERVAA